MKTTLQLLATLAAEEKAWRAHLSGADGHSRGVADGILFAITAIKESYSIPGDTPVVPPLMKLASALSARATDINCAHAHTQEDAAVRRSMVVIYTELAETIKAALQ